jgi:hypothetical protein
LKKSFISNSWLTVTFLTLSFIPFLTFSGSEEILANKEIQLLYNKMQDDQINSTEKKLNYISNYFLGRPYLLGALGEGEAGKYDQFPLYRTDAFDCITYVETVLALTFSTNLNEFQNILPKIRYENGKISYPTRNHFPSVDWNPNNQKQKFLKDITETIYQQNGEKAFRIAEAMIDKPSYYAHLNNDNLRVSTKNELERSNLLNEMKKEGGQFQPVLGKIAYLPLSILFSPSGDANSYIFNQIPNGSIIEIVRPNWDLTKIIGTHQNVSHIGFVFVQNGTLMFRDASFLKGAISNTPLVEYLRKYINQESTVKGINIQIIDQSRLS